MSKSITTVYLDSEILSLLKLAKMENENFNKSQVVNTLLRGYFDLQDDDSDLEKKKQDIKDLRKEIDEKVTLLKSKQGALSMELKKQEKEFKEGAEV